MILSPRGDLPTFVLISQNRADAKRQCSPTSGEDGDEEDKQNVSCSTCRTRS
jgi:hypothetical protein